VQIGVFCHELICPFVAAVGALFALRFAESWANHRFPRFVLTG